MAHGAMLLDTAAGKGGCRAVRSIDGIRRYRTIRGMQRTKSPVHEATGTATYCTRPMTRCWNWHWPRCADCGGVSGFPVFQNEVRIIPSIPQYNAGYGEVEETIDYLEAESPGRFFAGNYRDGISVADCIQGGVGACSKLTGYLSHA